MRNGSRRQYLVHAFVECRTRGTGWWLYARPTLPPDEELAALLVGTEVEPAEEPVRALGIPYDVSLAVRDEYTWRVAGPAGGDAPNIVSVNEAERWIARGLSRRWTTPEPFVRVTDPRWSHPSWLDSAELARVLDRYEDSAGQPSPAAYCALLAMMTELERDFIVRLVIWMERPIVAPEAWIEPHAIFLRDHLVDLERARAHVRSRRRRRRRTLGSES
jgi:hypothetical protein